MLAQLEMVTDLLCIWSDLGRSGRIQGGNCPGQAKNIALW